MAGEELKKFNPFFNLELGAGKDWTFGDDTNLYQGHDGAYNCTPGDTNDDGFNDPLPGCGEDGKTLYKRNDSSLVPSVNLTLGVTREQGVLRGGFLRFSAKSSKTSYGADAANTDPRIPYYSKRQTDNMLFGGFYLNPQLGINLNLAPAGGVIARSVTPFGTIIAHETNPEPVIGPDGMPLTDAHGNLVYQNPDWGERPVEETMSKRQLWGLGLELPIFFSPTSHVQVGFIPSAAFFWGAGQFQGMEWSAALRGQYNFSSIHGVAIPYLWLEGGLNGAIGMNREQTVLTAQLLHPDTSFERNTFGGEVPNLGGSVSLGGGIRFGKTGTPPGAQSKEIPPPDPKVDLDRYQGDLAAANDQDPKAIALAQFLNWSDQPLTQATIAQAVKDYADQATRDALIPAGPDQPQHQKEVDAVFVKRVVTDFSAKKSAVTDLVFGISVKKKAGETLSLQEQTLLTDVEKLMAAVAAIAQDPKKTQTLADAGVTGIDRTIGNVRNLMNPQELKLDATPQSAFVKKYFADTDRKAAEEGLYQALVGQLGPLFAFDSILKNKKVTVTFTYKPGGTPSPIQALVINPLLPSGVSLDLSKWIQDVPKTGFPSVDKFPDNGVEFSFKLGPEAFFAARLFQSVRSVEETKQLSAAVVKVNPGNMSDPNKMESSLYLAIQALKNSGLRNDAFGSLEGVITDLTNSINDYRGPHADSPHESATKTFKGIIESALSTNTSLTSLYNPSQFAEAMGSYLAKHVNEFRSVGRVAKKVVGDFPFVFFVRVNAGDNEREIKQFCLDNIPQWIAAYQSKTTPSETASAVAPAAGPSAVTTMAQKDQEEAKTEFTRALTYTLLRNGYSDFKDKTLTLKLSYNPNGSSSVVTVENVSDIDLTAESIKRSLESLITQSKIALPNKLKWPADGKPVEFEFSLTHLDTLQGIVWGAVSDKKLESSNPQELAQDLAAKTKEFADLYSQKSSWYTTWRVLQEVNLKDSKYGVRNPAEAAANLMENVNNALMVYNPAMGTSADARKTNGLNDLIVQDLKANTGLKTAFWNLDLFALCLATEILAQDPTKRPAEIQTAVLAGFKPEFFVKDRGKATIVKEFLTKNIASWVTRYERNLQTSRELAMMQAEINKALPSRILENSQLTSDAVTAFLARLSELTLQMIKDLPGATPDYIALRVVDKFKSIDLANTLLPQAKLMVLKVLPEVIDKCCTAEASGKASGEKKDITPSGGTILINTPVIVVNSQKASKQTALFTLINQDLEQAKASGGSLANVFGSNPDIPLLSRMLAAVIANLKVDSNDTQVIAGVLKNEFPFALFAKDEKGAEKLRYFCAKENTVEAWTKGASALAENTPSAETPRRDLVPLTGLASEVQKLNLGGLSPDIAKSRLMRLFYARCLPLVGEKGVNVKFSLREGSSDLVITVDSYGDKPKKNKITDDLNALFTSFTPQAIQTLFSKPDDFLPIRLEFPKSSATAYAIQPILLDHYNALSLHSDSHPFVQALESGRQGLEWVQKFSDQLSLGILLDSNGDKTASYLTLLATQAFGWRGAANLVRDGKGMILAPSFLSKIQELQDTSNLQIFKDYRNKRDVGTGTKARPYSDAEVALRQTIARSISGALTGELSGVVSANDSLSKTVAAWLAVQAIDQVPVGDIKRRMPIEVPFDIFAAGRNETDITKNKEKLIAFCKTHVEEWVKPYKQVKPTSSTTTDIAGTPAGGQVTVNTKAPDKAPPKPEPKPESTSKEKPTGQVDADDGYPSINRSTNRVDNIRVKFDSGTAQIESGNNLADAGPTIGGRLNAHPDQNIVIEVTDPNLNLAQQRADAIKAELFRTWKQGKTLYGSNERISVNAKKGPSNVEFKIVKMIPVASKSADQASVPAGPTVEKPAALGGNSSVASISKTGTRPTLSTNNLPNFNKSEDSAKLTVALTPLARFQIQEESKTGARYASDIASVNQDKLADDLSGEITNQLSFDSTLTALELARRVASGLRKSGSTLKNNVLEALALPVIKEYYDTWNKGHPQAPLGPKRTAVEQPEQKAAEGKAAASAFDKAPSSPSVGPTISKKPKITEEKLNETFKAEFDPLATAFFKSRTIILDHAKVMGLEISCLPGSSDMQVVVPKTVGREKLKVDVALNPEQMELFKKRAQEIRDSLGSVPNGYKYTFALQDSTNRKSERTITTNGWDYGVAEAVGNNAKKVLQDSAVLALWKAQGIEVDLEQVKVVLGRTKIERIDIENLPNQITSEMKGELLKELQVRVLWKPERKGGAQPIAEPVTIFVFDSVKVDKNGIEVGNFKIEGIAKPASEVSEAKVTINEKTGLVSNVNVTFKPDGRTIDASNLTRVKFALAKYLNEPRNKSKYLEIIAATKQQANEIKNAVGFSTLQQLIIVIPNDSPSLRVVDLPKVTMEKGALSFNPSLSLDTKLNAFDFTEAFQRMLAAVEVWKQKKTIRRNYQIEVSGPKSLVEAAKQSLAEKESSATGSKYPSSVPGSSNISFKADSSSSLTISAKTGHNLDFFAPNDPILPLVKENIVGNVISQVKQSEQLDGGLSIGKLTFQYTITFDEDRKVVDVKISDVKISTVPTASGNTIDYDEQKSATDDGFQRIKRAILKDLKTELRKQIGSSTNPAGYKIEEMNI